MSNNRIIAPIGDTFLDDFIAVMISEVDVSEKNHALREFSTAFDMILKQANIEGSDSILPIMENLLPNDLIMLNKLNAAIALDGLDYNSVMLTNFQVIVGLKIDIINGANLPGLRPADIKNINQFMVHYNNAEFLATCKTNTPIIHQIDSCIALVQARYPVHKNVSPAQQKQERMILEVKMRPLSQARKGLVQGKSLSDILPYLKQAKELHHEEKSIFQKISQLLRLIVATISRNQDKKEALLFEKQFSGNLEKRLNNFFPKKDKHPPKTTKATSHRKPHK